MGRGPGGGRDDDLSAPAPGWWLASDGNWYPPAGAAPLPPQAVYGTPPPYGPPGAGAYGYVPSTNGLAVAALVTALIGLSLPAVICGHVGLRQVDASGGREEGRGLAIAGLVIGWIGCVGWVLLWISVAMVVASSPS